MFFVLDFGFRNDPIKDTASSALINVEILTIPPLGKLGLGIVLLEVIFNTLSKKKKKNFHLKALQILGFPLLFQR
jgi:hypothetical protein